MKFSDIEYFQPPSYQVNIDWDYLPRILERYKTEYNLELNPDFQRGYIWTEQQQIQYVEYLLRGGISGIAIFFNHPHWMDFSKMGNIVLVDGKQRIETATKFMNNKLKVFGYYFEEFEGPLPTFQLQFIFRINNLKDPNDVVKWYISMNSGGSVHTKEDIDRAKRCLSINKL